MPQRERPEDALALVVGVGGGVDRAHCPQRPVTGLQLPAQEQADADDPTVVLGDHAGRAPNGLSRCFQSRKSWERSPVGPPASAAVSSSRTAGASSSTSGRKVRVGAVVTAPPPPPAAGARGPGSGRPAGRPRAGSRSRRRARDRPRRAGSGTSGSRATQAIAEASAPGSDGGTSRPYWPWMTSSGIPPTLVATTGTPAASASTSAIERPSWMLERTKVSRPGSSSGTSSRIPRNRTASSSPSSRVSLRSSCSRGPVPMTTRRASRSSPWTTANARSIVPWSFLAARLPTVP